MRDALARCTSARVSMRPSLAAARATQPNAAALLHAIARIARRAFVLVRLRLQTALLLSAWLALWPNRAHAQPRRPSLHWTRSARAADCIDARALAARVEQLTGPVLVRPSEADYIIEGHVDQQAARFIVRVTVTGPDGVPHGERVLEQTSSSCRTLDASIAFVVALTIDPDLELDALLPPASESRPPEEALLAEISEVPAVAPVLPPTPPVEPARPAAEIAPPSSQPRFRGLELRAGALAAWRELPQPSFGLVAAARARLGRWLALELQTRGAVAVRPYEVASSRSLRAQSFALAPLACGRHARSVVGVEGCVGVEPLLVRARGSGFDQSATARLLSWGALARVAGEYAWREHWRFFSQLQLRIALDEKRLVYSDDADTRAVFALRRVSGMLTIGVGRLFASGKRAPDGTDERDREERGP